MPGTLYLCATPIGNLGDMTPRVVETLQTVDVIAAEDTRNSIKLLNHFDIHTPMTSYHEYNKVEKAHQPGDLRSRRSTGADVPGAECSRHFPAGSCGLYYSTDLIRTQYKKVLL